MQRTLPEQFWKRVVIQTLKLTRSGRSTALDIVASHARCASDVARGILDSLEVSCENGHLEIPPETRLRLAREASQDGFLGEVARTLDWREFESFTRQCLAEAGYKVERNVRTRDKGRIREVDVVASKGNLVLCIDCKHWNTPYYPSKFNKTLEHQLEATQMLLRELSRRETSTFSGLPVVLTLLEPREKLRNGVVLLSIGQLPNFLEGLSELENLPFVKAEAGAAENPIKEA